MTTNKKDSQSFKKIEIENLSKLRIIKKISSCTWISKNNSENRYLKIQGILRTIW